MADARTLNQCDFCGEPVLESDRLSRPLADGTRRHWECDLRYIVGGVNHVTRQNCQCCGGSQPEDPPGVTRRVAARLAADAYRQRAGDQVVEEVMDMRLDLLAATDEDDQPPTGPLL